jgi:hypothetical protein
MVNSARSITAAFAEIISRRTIPVPYAQPPTAEHNNLARSRQTITFRSLKRLPAASATTAAPTAVAAAPAAAVPTSASAVASAASGVFCLRTSLVHVERASAHLRTIQCRDGLLSIVIAGHLYKSETARSPGIPIGHNADPVHLPERLKHLPQLIFRSVKAQVPYENVLHESPLALSCRSASSMRRTWQVGDTFLKIETGAGNSSNAGKV